MIFYTCDAMFVGPFSLPKSVKFSKKTLFLIKFQGFLTDQKFEFCINLSFQFLCFWKNKRKLVLTVLTLARTVVMLRPFVCTKH